MRCVLYRELTAGPTWVDGEPRMIADRLARLDEGEFGWVHLDDPDERDL